MKPLKDSRILVTGGAGFIGSHLIEKLVSLGANVNVIDKKDSSLDNLKDVINKIKVFRTDLLDLDDIKKITSEISPEIIFHLAANVTSSRDLNTIDKSIENIKMTINLLKSLDNYELFVNTGTVEEYGNEEPPFKEDQLPVPVSPYSASKLAITNYCKMLHITHGFPIVTVRPFLTYGPRQKSDIMLIPTLILSALNKKDFKMTMGEQTREFNYVGDMVDGYIAVASSKKVIGEIINIGNGKAYKVNEVVEKILNIMGNPIKVDKSMPYREGEIMHLYCDNTKAKRLLDWEPKTNLEDGLRKTIWWYENEYRR